MFQQIEEMPPEAFTQAFDWTWEDFAGYRDAIEKSLSINVAPLVGHSVIRLWVMGADAAAARRHRRTRSRRCRTCCASAWTAGAVGLSTSFVDVDENGRPVPSRFAQLRRARRALRRARRVRPHAADRAGVLRHRHHHRPHRPAGRAVAEARHPDHLLAGVRQHGDARHRAAHLARVEEQFARGARVWPQMQTRPIDISFSLLRPSLFFARLPRWVRMLRLPLDERDRGAAAIRRPRAKLVADAGPDGGAADAGRPDRARRRRGAGRPVSAARSARSPPSAARRRRGR